LSVNVEGKKQTQEKGNNKDKKAFYEINLEVARNLKNKARE
jgi:hypothetical protein